MPLPHASARVLLATLGAVALAVLLVAVVGPAAPERPAVPAHVAAPNDGDRAASGPAADREAAPLLRPERTMPAPGDVRCVGRCVDWSTGSPLARCRISITASASVTTDTDGRFVVAIARDVTRIEVVVEARERVAVTRRLDVETDATDFGDVRLRRGAEVHGTLVDERGAPQAHAALHARCEARVDRDDGWQERFDTQTRTRADGSFAFPAPLPAGAATFDAPDTPPLVGQTSFALRAGLGPVQLTCRFVEPRDTITGVVVDRTGFGVAGALVQAFDENDVSGPPVAWTRADAEGHFVIVRPEHAPERVHPMALGACAAQRSTDEGGVPWGTHALVLALGDGHGVWLQVVEHGSGDAIEHFAVQCVPTAGTRLAADAARRAAGHHREGWARIQGLAPGAHRLIVWPDDPRWLPSLPSDFDRDGCGGTLRIALHRAEPCPVRVLDAAGEPVAGIDVQMIAPAEGHVVRDLDRLFDHGGSRAAVGMRLGRARTDARGVAQLTWFDDPTPRLLRLSGPGIAPHEQHHVPVGPDGTVVRLAPAGRLELRLAGAGGCRIELLGDEPGAHLPPPWLEPIRLDADGTVQLPIPAGRWRVALHAPTANREGASAWLPMGEIATADVTAGGTTKVERDLGAALAPASFVGFAFVDGAPAPVVTLLCGGEDVDGQPRVVHSMEAVPDERGAFRFEGLRRGRYRLQVCFPCQGRQVVVAAGPWTPLAPAEHKVAGDAAVTTTRVVVRTRDAAGGAARGGWIVLRSAPDTVLLAPLDDDGVATFERVPAGRYELRRRNREASLLLGELLVGTSPVDHTTPLR